MEFLESDIFLAIFFGIIFPLGLIVVWRHGPGHAKSWIICLLVSFAYLFGIVFLAVPFDSEIGRALGGLTTWAILVLGAPVLLLIYIGIRRPRDGQSSNRRDTQDD